MAAGNKTIGATSIKGIISSRRFFPYIFILPFILSFLIFFLYPIISTFEMSLQSIKGFDSVEFIGLKNYKNLFNRQFFNALNVTARYTFWTILILIPIPLVLANILNSHLTRGSNIYKSALFMPALTSVVMAGLFFKFAFAEQPTALINSIIVSFGGEPFRFLYTKTGAMIVLVLFCTWKWMGVNLIYYISALKSIPGEIYESAEIDGANAIQKFFKITVPSVRPTIIYVLTISVYGGFSMFAESFTLFNGARSPGDIGTTLVGYIYNQGINQNNFGLASAAGLVLLGMVLVINVIQLFLTGAFRKEA
ncbi:MAG: sugar ABC transporter permease [Clostridiaceae bacterium]|nr:sugar ABC transporter permease [Clostridiaceae bacterium]